MIVRAAPVEHYGWLLSRIEYAPTSGFRAIEAIRGDDIVGMVGADSWTVNSVSLHVAIDDPHAVRPLARAVFKYVFRQCDRGIALGVVPAHNKRALRLDKGIGFREVHRIRDGWAPGDDMVILEMRRDECRWLRKAA